MFELIYCAACYILNVLILFSNKCFVRFNGYALLYSSRFRRASLILSQKYRHLLFLLTSLPVSSNMMLNNELLELRKEFPPKNTSDTTKGKFCQYSEAVVLRCS